MRLLVAFALVGLFFLPSCRTSLPGTDTVVVTAPPPASDQPIAGPADLGGPLPDATTGSPDLAMSPPDLAPLPDLARPLADLANCCEGVHGHCENAVGISPPPYYRWLNPTAVMGACQLVPQDCPESCSDEDGCIPWRDGGGP